MSVEDRGGAREPYIPLSVVVAIAGVVFGLYVGLAYRAEGASLLIVSILVAYVAVSILNPRAVKTRLLLALLLVCTHLGVVLTYYSDPIVLPFIVLERSAEGSSANLDFTQAILAYELVNFYKTSRVRQQRESGESEEQEGGAGREGATAIETY